MSNVIAISATAKKISNPQSILFLQLYNMYPLKSLQCLISTPFSKNFDIVRVAISKALDDLKIKSYIPKKTTIEQIVSEMKRSILLSQI